MKVAGIISEYNPFHKGHEYHITETRKFLGSDSAIVAVMSGNYVQRGDFAIMDKLSRARCALADENGEGVDLILELPVPYSLSSAEGFARGAVYLISALGIVDYLSFGSESQDISSLNLVAETVLSEAFDNEIKIQLSKGISFAAARQKAVETLLGSNYEQMRSPNDILAIEYLKSLRLLNSKIIPLAVPRFGAGHDREDINFPSAKQLRELLLSGKDITHLLPERTAKILKEEIACGKAPVSFKNCERAILSALRTLSDNQYKDVDSSGEGLWRRLMANARTESSLNVIIDKTKTKRYARARLSRMIMRAYLGVPTEPLILPTYIRALAFNKKGRTLLRRAKGLCKLPIITKPAHAQRFGAPVADMFRLSAHTTDLFVLAMPDTKNANGGQEWLDGPVIIG